MILRSPTTIALTPVLEGASGAMTTFAQFADCDRVRALLGQYLPEYAGPMSIARCEALVLRYRTVLEEPRRSFLKASYLLHLRNSTTGEEREQIVYLKRMMAERIAFHTGQPVERIETDSDRDRWFTAEEARDYGFIDQVIERSVATTITT